MLDVIKKLKFGDNAAVIINAPLDLKMEFENLDYTFEFDKKTKSKCSLIFVNDSKSFYAFFNKKLKHIEPDSKFWITYPKGSSGIKTDINRDWIHLAIEEYGLKTVAAVSINEIWSAMRFRPIDKVGK
jgi:hypothetical protein